MFDNRLDLEPEDLLEHAKELGLNMDQFKQDLRNPEVEARIQMDIAEAKRMKLRGTPAFLINGKRYVDPKSPDDFLDWIEEAAATRQPAP